MDSKQVAEIGNLDEVLMIRLKNWPSQRAHRTRVPQLSRASRVLILLLMGILVFGPGYYGLSRGSIAHALQMAAYDGGLSHLPPTDIPTNRPFDYIVVVLMENRNYADIIGNPSAPYINRLANNYGLATNYHNVSNYRSLPNYLALVAGNTYDSWARCNASPSICAGWSPVKDSAIMDRIEAAGMTWKAYMEDMPSDCYQFNTTSYVTRHNPFVYFAHVLNTTSECNKVIPAGTKASRLIADLASTTTAPNFLWLTPNLCDDMHNCSTSIGDVYLSQVIPEILTSPVFQTQRAALFLTWDEGSSSSQVPAIWAGPTVRNNFTSGVNHNHYSLLKTVETIWNLPPLTSNDAGGSPMTEFLAGPTPSFTYVPSQPGPGQTITFNGTASGGASPYKFNWSFGDGGTATETKTAHTYIAPGSYNVTLSVSDWLNHTGLTFVRVNVSDFTIAASYPILTVPAGDSIASTLTLQSRNGFTGTIALSAEASPSGATVELAPDHVLLSNAGAANATLTFLSSTPGTYTVTVQATHGPASQTITQTFRVEPQTTSTAPVIPPATILGFPLNQIFTMGAIVALGASGTILVGRRFRPPKAEESLPSPKLSTISALPGLEDEPPQGTAER